MTDAGREAGKPEEKVEKEELLELCHSVSERTAQIHKRRTSLPTYSLLDIALDHLSLGRSALYAAILEFYSSRCEPTHTFSRSSMSQESQFGFTSAATELDLAVSGLRKSGNMDDLPLGLLSRAWLRSLTGPHTGPDSAQRDLDEACEIAERGPMQLFLADIHLYRTRLFFRETPYPWESPQHDLCEARRLIYKHGYLRRKEELEDAESALACFLGETKLGPEHR